MMSANPTVDPQPAGQVPAPIQVEHFTSALLLLLDETFDNVHGYYLECSQRRK